MSAPVQHRDGAFVVEQQGKRIAELTYRTQDGAAVVDHTWVDPQHRGGSLAGDLVAALAAWARESGTRVVPVCPYVKRGFEQDQRYSDLRG